MQDAQTLRDTIISAVADRASCIQIRQNGHMATLQSLMLGRGCEVDTRFVCSDSDKKPAAPLITKSAAANEQAWPYLTHYTREPDGAWPDETYADYLRWLASGDYTSTRDGFGALCRILEQRRVRASGFLMPASAPMVCFTAHPPIEALALRKWRRGLRRWTFAPYGLAIMKWTLQELGARPIIYASDQAIKDAPGSARRWMQMDKPGPDTRWSGEAEWRIAGDLDISTVEKPALLALVTNQNEATEVQRRFGISAHVL
jgi:hypothetical protein